MSQWEPPQRKKRHWARNIVLGAIGLAALIVVIFIVATGGGVSNTPTVLGGTGTPTPSATHVAAPVKLGSYVNVQDSTGDTYGVALTKVIDPAHSTDQVTPASGERFVGAVFTIKTSSGNGPQQQDAEDDAVLVGSNGQTYLPDVIPIVGYTDFAVGEVHAAPGQSTIGAIAFQVPTKVKVSKVQWSTFSSFGAQSTVQWNVR